ncbi:MAG TPA: mechanosensitive ion channel family protein [Micropepsaceae bacterium]|nr:mechanosensitive ion channel family protein [Micropepsaceae bacterium]
MDTVRQILFQRPELIALAVFIFAFGGVHSLTKRHTVQRIVLGALFFLGFTWIMFQARQVPYAVPRVPRDPLSGFLGDGLKTIWWFWAASLCSDALRLFASRGHTPLARYRLTQDLSVAGIYLCALIGLTTFVLNLPLQGLLVTSGAVAVVLGLALQSALGDVFYGIMLTLGKPYELGDWITIDNGAEGTVVEMNWRATHLLTDRQDVAIVPNSVIAKARIVNASYPSRTHGTVIRLPLAPQTSPGSAVRLLADSALACRQVLMQPPPCAVIKSMSAEATTFAVTFYTSEVGSAGAAQTAVYENIYRALRIAGIALGNANAVSPPAVVDPPATAALRLAASAPVFANLRPEQRGQLASGLKLEEYEPGQIVVEQGAQLSGLVLVAEGVVSVRQRSGDRVDELDRIGAGGAFGSRELQQAAPAAASVTALTKATIFRLEKAWFAKLLSDAAAPGSQADGRDTAAAGVREWFARQVERA